MDVLPLPVSTQQTNRLMLSSLHTVSTTSEWKIIVEKNSDACGTPNVVACEWRMKRRMEWSTEHEPARVVRGTDAETRRHPAHPAIIVDSFLVAVVVVGQASFVGNGNGNGNGIAIRVRRGRKRASTLHAAPPAIFLIFFYPKKWNGRRRPFADLHSGFPFVG